MTKAEIKALIDALITTNGDGEITGAGLNQVLTEMNDSAAAVNPSDLELWYLKYIAGLYGATRNDSTGKWTYGYTNCARWDSATNSIKWDLQIKYTDLTDAQIKLMVDNRLLALSGTYGTGKLINSPVAFHFRGYGNNSNVSSNAYIYNQNIQTFGYIGTGNIARGDAFIAHGPNEIDGMLNLKHLIGCVNATSNWTLNTTYHTNIEYLTLRFNANNQTHDLRATQKLRFECILYTIQDQPTRANCTLKLHPTLYDKIYNSSNPDYSLWHKIAEANEARANRVNITNA